MSRERRLSVLEDEVREPRAPLVGPGGPGRDPRGDAVRSWRTRSVSRERRSSRTRLDVLHAQAEPGGTRFAVSWIASGARRGSARRRRRPARGRQSAPRPPPPHRHPQRHHHGRRQRPRAGRRAAAERGPQQAVRLIRGLRRRREACSPSPGTRTVRATTSSSWNGKYEVPLAAAMGSASGSDAAADGGRSPADRFIDRVPSR